MHFRILKMIATSGFLAALECNNFDFSRGSTQDPAGGAYSAPRPPSRFKGPTSKGRGGEGTGKEGTGGRGRVGEGEWGEWKRRGRDARERGREWRKKERRKREGEGRKVRTPLRQFLPTPLLPDDCRRRLEENVNDC